MAAVAELAERERELEIRQQKQQERQRRKEEATAAQQAPRGAAQEAHPCEAGGTTFGESRGAGACPACRGVPGGS